MFGIFVVVRGSRGAGRLWYNIDFVAWRHTHANAVLMEEHRIR